MSATLFQAPRLTAREVLDVLERRYRGGNGQWVFLRELRVGTGWGGTDVHHVEDPLFMAGEQRMDAWAINCWPSTYWDIHAFEVKVSRSDLRHELAHPEKRAAAMRLSHRFFFVLADGFEWEDLDIPANCGVLVARKRGITEERRAERRYCMTPPWAFVASALRRSTGWTLQGTPAVVSGAPGECR